MSLNAMGLGLLFQATDRVSGPVAKMSARYDGFVSRILGGNAAMERSQKRFGMGMKLMATGAGITAGAFSLAGAAGKFEQSIAAVGLVSRASAADLKSLENAAIQAGLKTQFSPDEAAQGLLSLSQAGLNAKDSINALNPALDLAAAGLGKLSPDEGAGLAIQAMKAYGVAAEDVGDALDKMLKSTMVARIAPEDLSLALSNATGGAQAIKASLTETVATIGFMKNVIDRTETAATSAGLVMERLSDPVRAKKLGKMLGIEVSTAEGKFRDFLDVALDLSKAQARLGLNDTQFSGALFKIFSSKGAKGMNAIIGQLQNGIKDTEGNVYKGADAIAFLRGEIGNATGTAANFRNTLLNTFEGQKTLLKGTMQTIAVVVGQTFTKLLMPAVQRTLAVANKFLVWFKALPQPVKDGAAKIAMFASAALSIAGALLAAKMAVVFFVGGLLSASGVVVGIAANLAWFSATGIALAAVALTIREMWTNNIGQVRSIVGSWGEDLQLFHRGAVDIFRTGELSKAVVSDMSKAENTGVRSFLLSLRRVHTGVQEIARGFSEGITGAMDRIAPAINGAMLSVSDFVGEIGRMIQTLTGAAEGGDWFTSIGQGAATLVAWIVGLAANIVDILADIGFGFVGSFIYAFNALKGPVSEVVTFFMPLFNVLAQGFEWLINSSGELSWLFKAVGVVMAGPLIGGFAIAGGAIWAVVKALKFLWKGILWVKEKAPEAFTKVSKGVKSAMSTFGGIIDKYILDPLDSVISFVNAAIAGVKWFFKGVIGFFVGIGRGIGQAFDKLFGWVRSVIRSLPSGVKKFLPDSVLSFANSSVTASLDMSAINDDLEIGQLAAPTRDTFDSEGNRISPAPGGVRDVTIDPTLRDGRDQEPGITAVDFRALLEEVRANNKRPIQTQVIVDGEVLADTVVDGLKRSEQRQFMEAG